MRCKIEIDLKRLEENYAAIENYIRKPLIAVVKSNAYGHGLLPIVSAMHRLGVNSFLVATMEEAVLLRTHFRNIAILLLEPGEDFQTMYALRITPCVNSFSYLKQLIETRLPFPIHLKLETGLNRLGIYPSQEKECLQLIEKSRLSVRGVYTHIASEKSYPGQMYLFKKMLAPFSDIENLQIHIGSSHYLIPDGLSTHYRVGLALYGLMKHPEIPLKPILSLKAPVYRVKKVLRGEEIGYHNAGIVKEDGYLCTIPLGYADGWIKERKTIGFHETYLSQIGETCMDLMMLFSKNYIEEKQDIELISDNVDIFDLAGFYGESIYQIVTLLSPRIQRTYRTD